MIPQSERTAPAKPKKGARAKERGRAARLKVTNRKAVYARVDLREGGLCRFTRKGVWLEHHHIVKRSQGGGDTTSNLVLITKALHDAVEGHLYDIEGDADGVLTLKNNRTGVVTQHPVPEVRD